MTRGSYDKSMSERYLPSTDDAVPDDPPKGKKEQKEEKEVTDPVSGGIFTASINVIMIDERLRNINNKIKFMQSESNALGLGLDYTKELKNVGNAIKIVRVAGFAVGVAGVSYDFYNTFLKNEPTMSVGKFSINTTMTVIGFLGVPGAIISGTYFGVDTFVPGGWKTVGKNEYKMYNLHIQNGVMAAPWLIGK